MCISMIRKKYRKIIYILIFVLILFQAAAADYKKEREKLVEEHIKKEGIKDPQVIKSMLSVPREEFVPEDMKKKAYLDQPLPIGYGQTISQPYIVALMTNSLS